MIVVRFPACVRGGADKRDIKNFIWRVVIP